MTAVPTSKTISMDFSEYQSDLVEIRKSSFDAGYKKGQEETLKTVAKGGQYYGWTPIEQGKPIPDKTVIAMAAYEGNGMEFFICLVIYKEGIEKGYVDGFMHEDSYEPMVVSHWRYQYTPDGKLPSIYNEDYDA